MTRRKLKRGSRPSLNLPILNEKPYLVIDSDFKSEIPEKYENFVEPKVTIKAEIVSNFEIVEPECLLNTKQNIKTDHDKSEVCIDTMEPEFETASNYLINDTNNDDCNYSGLSNKQPCMFNI